MKRKENRLSHSFTEMPNTDEYEISINYTGDCEKGVDRLEIEIDDGEFRHILVYNHRCHTVFYKKVESACDAVWHYLSKYTGRNNRFFVRKGLIDIIHALLDSGLYGSYTYLIYVEACESPEGYTYKKSYWLEYASDERPIREDTEVFTI